MTINVYVVLMTTIVYIPTRLHCQDSVTSEVMVNTCITFNESNNTGTLYINRFTDSICAFLEGKTFTRSTAWNRSFSCNESISGVSVCFTNTMASDAGVFYLVVNDNTEYNTTLTVEYPPKALPLGTRRTIEGSSFSITCPYSAGNPSLTTVYWEKENSSDRYTNQTLTIPNINRTESGNYVCFAENTYSSGIERRTNSTMFLDVQYPPSIRPFSDQTPVEGTTHEITCYITEGNPEALARVFWTRSGHGTIESGEKLTISRVQRSHAGTYACHAQNTYDDGTQGEASQSVRIDVEYPPNVTSFNPTYPMEHSDFSIDCSATPGNPPSIEYYWTRPGDNNFRQNSTKLQLIRIDRNQTGTYVCTAFNFYSNGEEGSNSQTLAVNVQYPPVVSPIKDVKAVEHTDFTVRCTVTPGNPSNTTLYWTKSGDSGFKKFDTTLVLNSISRSDSGTYSCVAENSYQSVGKGTGQQSFVLDVLYGPTFTNAQDLTVAEGQRAWLSASLTSNPPSNVSWYKGNNLQWSQVSVSGTTSYTIARTQCNDTGNFFVTASNEVQSITTTVSLFINCSPRLTLAGDTVTFYVTNNRYLHGEIWILSYPRPNFTIALPNGAPNTHITTSITSITSNQFKLEIVRSGLQPEDYGRYSLEFSNNYGRKTVYVNIIPRSKPYPPDQVLVNCGHGEASITWQSSYFGYENQYSIVQFSTDNAVFVNGSYNTTENTKQGIYQTTVYNIPDNTQYFFRVTTINSYGFSTSSVEKCSTTNSQDEPSDSSAVLVGSILGTLLVLALGAVVVISFKYLPGVCSLKNFTVRKSRDSPLNEVNIGKSTGIDNHLYEPLNSENQGVSETNIEKFRNQDQNPTVNTNSETDVDARYTAFSASNRVDLALANPQKTPQEERVYENIQVSATKTLGTVSEKTGGGKVKPQILPKPKKALP